MRMLTLDSDFADIDKTVGINIDVPKGHASVFFSSGSWMIFPDEAWPRSMAVIREVQELPPDREPKQKQIRPPDGSRLPAEAATTKHTVKDINKLIEQIRSGQPPELPEGKREKHYRDPALPGLYIRLLNTGVASWVVQWKSLGRQKKETLGNVRVFDRLEAIKAAKDLLAKVQLDRLDPHKARRERMRANKVTFATVAPLFLEDKIRKGELRPATVKSWKRYLITSYYFQSLHSLPIDEITRDQIQTRIDYIAVHAGNPVARSCWAVMSVFFDWARMKKKLPEGHPNPMTDVEQPKENPPRERVLTNDEIQLIWKTCDDWEAEAIHAQQIKASTGKWPRSGEPPTTEYARAVKLLFLTGCRRQEIGDLQWSELDLDNGELRIPGARIKNAVELCNPLADWAVKILRSVEHSPDRANVFGHKQSKRLGRKPPVTRSTSALSKQAALHRKIGDSTIFAELSEPV